MTKFTDLGETIFHSWMPSPWGAEINALAHARVPCTPPDDSGYSLTVTLSPDPVNQPTSRCITSIRAANFSCVLPAWFSLSLEFPVQRGIRLQDPLTLQPPNHINPTVLPTRGHNIAKISHCVRCLSGRPNHGCTHWKPARKSPSRQTMRLIFPLHPMGSIPFPLFPPRTFSPSQRRPLPNARNQIPMSSRRWKPRRPPP